LINIINLLTHCLRQAFRLKAKRSLIIAIWNFS
jgi:hypothetical protein